LNLLRAAIPQNIELLENRTPRHQFPSSRKPLIIEETPGPAELTVKDIFNDKFQKEKLSRGTSSMLTRTNKSTLTIREGPGPNKYITTQESILPSRPSFSIMKASRQSGSIFNNSFVPGPGDYDNKFSRKSVQNIIF